MKNPSNHSLNNVSYSHRRNATAIIIEHKDESAFREESPEPTVEEETYSPEKGDEGVEENVEFYSEKKCFESFRRYYSQKKRMNSGENGENTK
jgi:hypothetical protein